MNTIKALACFLLFTGVLSLGFWLDPLHILSDQYQAEFQPRSEAIIKATLTRKADIPALYPMSMDDGTYYLSQFGLHGIVMAAIHNHTRTDLPVFITHVRQILVVIFSATLALFLLSVRMKFGTLAALITMLLIMLSPWLSAFSRNLYWATALHFLPFAIAWTAYPLLRKRLGWLLSMLTFAVLLKSLCGYEYITAIIGSVAVAVFWHEYVGGNDFRGAVKRTFPVTAAALLGFFLALSIQAVQLAHYTGSEGIHELISRMLVRTVEPPSNQISLDGEYAALVAKKIGDTFGQLAAIRNHESDIARLLGNHYVLGAFVFFNYLRLPAVALPGSNLDIDPLVLATAQLPIIVPIVYLLAALSRAKKKPPDAEQRRRRYEVALLSFLAPLSWQVAAFGHMIYHLQINAIVYYMPFLLLAYLVVAIDIGDMLKKALRLTGTASSGMGFR